MKKMNRVYRDMLIPFVVAILALVLPALLIKFGIIDAYTAQIITLGGVNAIMAISVNIICGITGQLSLGQAGFMAIGAYSCIFLTQNCGIPLVFSIIIAGLITSIFGFLIGFPTLKLTGDYLAIVTLGFGEIIRVVLINLKSITGGANGKRFEDNITEIMSVLEGAELVAHNEVFDERFISTELWRCGISYKPLSRICTMETFKPILAIPSKYKKYGKYKNPKLEEVLNYLNISPEKVSEYSKKLFNYDGDKDFHDSRFDTTGMYVAVNVYREKLHGGTAWHNQFCL